MKLKLTEEQIKQIYEDSYLDIELGDRAKLYFEFNADKTFSYGEIYNPKIAGKSNGYCFDEKDLKKRILAAADEYNGSSGMPFQLGFSIGTCSAEASEGKTMDDCIKVADARMYEVKTERKAGR